MAIKDYYLTKTEDDAGETFLLKQLQKEAATGGGRRLLGSVVKRHSEFSPFSQTDYAIPRSIMSPGIIEKTLRDRKAQLIAELEIAGKVKVHKETTNTVKAEITGDTYYVVGLSSFKWKDLK